VQNRKHRWPRISTEAGIEIDANDEQSSNDASSIRASFEPDSKVNDESNEHFWKQCLQRISTEAGMQIDSNDEH
jgi:hypothetical protein